MRTTPYKPPNPSLERRGFLEKEGTNHPYKPPQTLLEKEGV